LTTEAQPDYYRNGDERRAPKRNKTSEHYPHIMRIVNSKSDREHVKTFNDFHTTRMRKGDIDPEKIADFATIPWNLQDCELIYKKLDGCAVFYIIELDEYAGSYEVGVSTQFGKRLYDYGGYFKSIQKGKSRFRCIKLTSDNSHFKIERFILFIAFVKGYKVDDNGESLYGECIRRSDEALKDLISFICLMNKNGGHAEIQFKGTRTKYFLNNKWCEGSNSGTTSYRGDRGIGQYNMAEHPEYRNFLANLRREEKEKEEE